jgi:hypothetical protein
MTSVHVTQTNLEKHFSDYFFSNNMTSVTQKCRETFPGSDMTRLTCQPAVVNLLESGRDLNQGIELFWVGLAKLAGNLEKIHNEAFSSLHAVIKPATNTSH